MEDESLFWLTSRLVVAADAEAPEAFSNAVLGFDEASIGISQLRDMSVGEILRNLGTTPAWFAHHAHSVYERGRIVAVCEAGLDAFTVWAFIYFRGNERYRWAHPSMMDVAGLDSWERLEYDKDLQLADVRTCGRTGVELANILELIQ